MLCTYSKPSCTTQLFDLRITVTYWRPSNSPPNRPLRSPSDKVYFTQDVLATTEIYITSTLRGLPVVHRRWSTSTPSKSPTFVHCAALFNWYVIPFANRSDNDGILICDYEHTDIFDGTARVTRFSVTHKRPGAVEDNTEQPVSVSEPSTQRATI